MVPFLMTVRKYAWVGVALHRGSLYDSDGIGVPDFGGGFFDFGVVESADEEGMEVLTKEAEVEFKGEAVETGSSPVAVSADTLVILSVSLFVISPSFSTFPSQVFKVRFFHEEGSRVGARKSLSSFSLLSPGSTPVESTWDSSLLMVTHNNDVKKRVT